jgi:hypothetical protein
MLLHYVRPPSPFLSLSLSPSSRYDSPMFSFIDFLGYFSFPCMPFFPLLSWPYFADFNVFHTFSPPPPPPKTWSWRGGERSIQYIIMSAGFDGNVSITERAFSCFVWMMISSIQYILWLDIIYSFYYERHELDQLVL